MFVVRLTVFDRGHAIVTDILHRMSVDRVVFARACTVAGEPLDLEAVEEVIVAAGFVALVVRLVVIARSERVVPKLGRVGALQIFVQLLQTRAAGLVVPTETLNARLDTSLALGDARLHNSGAPALSRCRSLQQP